MSGVEPPPPTITSVPFGTTGAGVSRGGYGLPSARSAAQRRSSLWSAVALPLSSTDRPSRRADFARRMVTTPSPRLVRERLSNCRIAFSGTWMPTLPEGGESSGFPKKWKPAGGASARASRMAPSFGFSNPLGNSPLTTSTRPGRPYGDSRSGVPLASSATPTPAGKKRTITARRIMKSSFGLKQGAGVTILAPMRSPGWNCIPFYGDPGVRDDRVEEHDRRRPRSMTPRSGRDIPAFATL